MPYCDGPVHQWRIEWLWVVFLATCFLSCGEDDPARPPAQPPSFEVVDWAYHMTPDGTRVLYRHRASRDRTGGVYILEIGDSVAQTLLFPDSLPFFASDCRFSPDGKRVVYTRDLRSDIYVHDLTDSTDTQVTFTNGNARSPDWDPTGRYIVYMRIFLDYGMPDSSAGLHVVDTETLEDISLRAAGNVVFGTDPRWSPGWVPNCILSSDYCAAVDNTQQDTYLDRPLRSNHDGRFDPWRPKAQRESRVADFRAGNIRVLRGGVLHGTQHSIH